MFIIIMDIKSIFSLRNIIIGVVGIVLVILLIIVVSIVLKYIKKGGLLNKCILSGSKNAKNSLVVRQSGVGPKKMVRTMADMNKGLEFTYSCWLYINSLEYNKDREMKPVFYKSMQQELVERDDLSESDYAPGVFLLKSNTLRVIMKTGSNAEMIDVSNIPIKKWFHFGLYIRQESMDVFINGQMVESKRLKTPPQQNDGDIYINTYGGYDGMLSDLKFYAYAISYDKLNKIMRKGPSSSGCSSKEVPPYFNDKWWIFR